MGDRDYNRHREAAGRMGRFDAMPLEWRDLARRTKETRLEYSYAQKKPLRQALKRLRLDQPFMTD